MSDLNDYFDFLRIGLSDLLRAKIIFYCNTQNKKHKLFNLFPLLK
jgi:hypothetical protein